MSTSITFHTANEDLTGITFADAPPIGLGGRLYGSSGNVISNSGVSLSLLGGDSTRGVINGLPEGPGYAVTYILKGFGESNHYYQGSVPYTYRVVANRNTGLEGTLDVRLAADGVIAGNIITITEAIVGQGDYIVKWGTDIPGVRYSLTIASGGFALGEYAWNSVSVSDVGAATWQRDDLGRVVDILNTHVNSFSGFDFIGWYVRGMHFQEPVIEGTRPQVFCEVSPGVSRITDVIGSQLTAPLRNGTYIFGLFSSVRNESIWRSVFKQMVKTLSTDFPPQQTTVIARDFEEPNESDIRGSRYPNFVAYTAQLPYRSCVR